MKICTLGTSHGAAEIGRACTSTLLRTGDVRADLTDYPTAAHTSEFDCIVSEMTHFNLTDIYEIFTRSLTKQFIFNHISKRNLNQLPPLEDKFPFPLHIASDGDWFEV